MALLYRRRNADAADKTMPVRVADGEGLSPGGVSAAIELGEFQADRQDSSWQGFLKKAKRHGAKLEAEGRDI